MFRDRSVSSESFVIKFQRLKKKLEEWEDVHLDSEYHKQLKEYIERIYDKSCMLDFFEDEMLDEMREAEMSNLNRLQKFKRENSYKKEKHKIKKHNEEWE